MKITIDTKEESVEDMRKLIRMLQNIVETRTPHSTISAGATEITRSTDAENSDGLFNMFNEDSSLEKDKEEKEETPRDEEETPKVEIVEF